MAELSPLPEAHLDEQAAELALGIVERHEAALARAHLESCARCKRQVEYLSPVAERLLDLVPGTEPPLGFDRRVLKAVGRRRPPSPVRRLPRRRVLLVAGAASVAVVSGVVGWMAGQGAAPAPTSSGVARPPGSEYPLKPGGMVLRTAALIASGRQVGQVVTYGRPPRLWVEVRGMRDSGMVVCQLVRPDGSVATVGTFELRDGSASWGVENPAGMEDAVGLRLVSASGRVMAAARL